MKQVFNISQEEEKIYQIRLSTSKYSFINKYIFCMINYGVILFLVSYRFIFINGQN